jgi:transcriptional regulator with XRE-family HTH domain
LEIARSSLTQAEAGNRKISAEELVAMAGLYGVSLAWLTSSDEAPEPETDRIQLAARELARLKPEDLQSVLQLVRSIRTRGRGRS